MLCQGYIPEKVTQIEIAQIKHKNFHLIECISWGYMD